MQLTAPGAAALLLVAALAGTALFARPAGAIQYEVFITVESEEDLYDLHATGQIDDEALATLVELFQRGVDLNKADRVQLYSLPNLTYSEVDAILEYRDLAGWISDPIDLVVNQIVSQEKLEGIAAFLLITDRAQPLLSSDGWVRGQTRYSPGDDGLAPMSLQARITTFQNLTVGAASAVTRNRLRDVRYDPSRGALSALEPDNEVHVPKVYARWETPKWGVIAGTYRIGFGQRLTFDNTSLYTPNGFNADDQLYRDTSMSRECIESAGELEFSPCSGAAGSVYGTPDYKWRDGLLGAAVGAKKLELGGANMQAYGFVSYQPRSIYQYQMYSRDRCDDPRDNDNPDCTAPEVFRRQGDPLDPTTRFSFQTLPDMYADLTGGGNLALSTGRRAHVGITGYGTSVNWLVDGLELDFQEWSRYPFGGPFGAVGVDGAFGAGRFDFFGEVTRSFDSMPDGGGGLAGLLRWVTTFEKYNELETSVRYYDKNFKNPYARPISAADVFEGVRARDEMGLRLRYSARLVERLNLRGNTDLWRAASGGNPDLLVYGRSDLELTHQYGVGLWALYQDKDLGRGGVGQCFETGGDDEFGEEGEPLGCGGEKYQATGRFRYSPTRRYTVTAQYQHELVADERYETRFRQDQSMTVTGSARVQDDLRLRGRARYLYEDISDKAYRERSVWTYLDATYSLRKRDKMRVRYDMYVYLDERDATMQRVPSPEHWFWLEYESRF